MSESVRGTNEYAVIVYVLDLFEGVLCHDWSSGRSFADHHFIMEVLILQVIQDSVLLMLTLLKFIGEKIIHGLIVETLRLVLIQLSLE